MSRAVYVGGFGNGKGNANRVAEALMAHNYDDVDVFTFSQAMASPDDIRKAVQHVDAFSHSAGMIALLGTQPESISAFNAPVPVSLGQLVARTLSKTVHMHQVDRGIKDPEDKASVRHYDASATAELVAHPLRNLGKLHEITKFNAYAAAIVTAGSGVKTTLVYTYEDDYFPLSNHSVDEKIAALKAGVAQTYLSGQHDELVLRPQATLDQYFGTTRK